VKKSKHQSVISISLDFFCKTIFKKNFLELYFLYFTLTNNDEGVFNPAHFSIELKKSKVKRRNK